MNKINLLVSSTDFRNGYLNIIDGIVNIPQDLPEGTFVVPGSYRNIELVYPQKVDEIIFGPPLNFLPPSELPNLLMYWKSRLNDNGTLKLNFIDIRRVAKRIQTEEINLQDTHNLIIGANKELNSIMDAVIVKTLAEKMGFYIESLIVQDVFGSIELKNTND